ncbi:unnamed protein product, partial [Discosporangium mesarthrocarpum]
MSSPDIIYAAVLDSARGRMDSVLCGLDLESVLEKQGKSGMRKGLADTVERLRKAAKNDIPPILDTLRVQAADLSEVSGIDPLLASSLSKAVQETDEVVAGIMYGSDIEESG